MAGPRRRVKMWPTRFALRSPSSIRTVGDLDGNVAKALAMVEQAEAADADLVLLPG